MDTLEGEENYTTEAPSPTDIEYHGFRIDFENPDQFAGILFISVTSIIAFGALLKRYKVVRRQRIETASEPAANLE